MKSTTDLKPVTHLNRKCRQFRWEKQTADVWGKKTSPEQIARTALIQIKLKAQMVWMLAQWTVQESVSDLRRWIEVMRGPTYFFLFPLYGEEQAWWGQCSQWWCSGVAAGESLCTVCLIISRLTSWIWAEGWITAQEVKSLHRGLRFPEVLVVLQTDGLLTEAEVQTRRLCNRGWGARTGYSTGGDAAIWTENTHTSSL